VRDDMNESTTNPQKGMSRRKVSAALAAVKESERVAVLPPGDLRKHRSFDGWTLELASRTLGAYKVKGGGAVTGVTRIDGSPGDRPARRDASRRKPSPATSRARKDAAKADGSKEASARSRARADDPRVERKTHKMPD